MDRLSNPSATLRAELEVLEGQVDDTINGHQDLLAHDARFHDLILASAGNPVVQQAYVQTHCHLHLFRLYPSDLDSQVTLTEHRGIRDAIAAADPTAAEEAMSAHLRSSFHRFARAFGAEPTALPSAALARTAP